jgi:hypothetical protein
VKSDQSKVTVIGQFFARSIGKTVSVSGKQGPRTLTLRLKKLRANAKAYYFELADESPEPPEVPQAGPKLDATVPSLPQALEFATASAGNDEDWGIP